MTRLAVTQRAAPAETVADTASRWVALGVPSVGLDLTRLRTTDDPAAEVQVVLDAGLTVSHLTAVLPFELDRPESWADARDEAGQLMDLAIQASVDTLVVGTGPAGDLPWERAADAFADAVRGLVAEGDREGVRIAIEPSPPWDARHGFVHRLADTVALAWRTGAAVAVDAAHAWAEPNLPGLLDQADATLAVVLVADRPRSAPGPSRLSPGDGDLPLTRVVRAVLERAPDALVILDAEPPGPGADADADLGRGVTALAHLTDFGPST